MAVANDVGEQSWPKVSSQINRVARFSPKRGADAEDQEEQHQGGQVAGAEIGIVLQGRGSCGANGN